MKNYTEKELRTLAAYIFGMARAIPRQGEIDMLDILNFAMKKFTHRLEEDSPDDPDALMNLDNGLAVFIIGFQDFHDYPSENNSPEQFS